jgi:phage gp29-like protein
MPSEDDETFAASPDGAQGDPATRRTELPHETKAKVEGSDAPKPTQTVDKLADAVLENLTGVTREWLSPVRPVFERLAALAMSGNVNDKDFMTALEKAQREMPELFERLNSGALETAFEEAIGTAMLAGSVKRYER